MKSSFVIPIHEAKTHLSRLLQRASAGEDIVIARGSQPIARLVALQPAGGGKRQPGSWKGRLTVPPEFFDELPEQELAAWE